MKWLPDTILPRHQVREIARSKLAEIASHTRILTTV